MTKQEWMDKLTQEGFKQLTECANAPYTEFPEHTHEKPTIHVILEGQLTLTDSKGPRTIKQGDWFNIPAGTTHIAKCGPEGCTFIVGEKG